MDGRHCRYIFTHTQMSTFEANNIKCNVLLSMTGQRQGCAHTQQALPLRQKHCARMAEASNPGLKSDTFGRFNYSTFGAANLLMFPNFALLYRILKLSGIPLELSLSSKLQLTNSSLWSSHSAVIPLPYLSNSADICNNKWLPACPVQQSTFIKGKLSRIMVFSGRKTKWG